MHCRLVRQYVVPCWYTNTQNFPKVGCGGHRLYSFLAVIKCVVFRWTVFNLISLFHG